MNGAAGSPAIHPAPKPFGWACDHSRIAHSSGASALDEEALALLRRAQPFPTPPPDCRASV
jgi:outer membrane biosynthesis protein TonB